MTQIDCIPRGILEMDRPEAEIPDGNVGKRLRFGTSAQGFARFSLFDESDLPAHPSIHEDRSTATVEYAGNRFPVYHHRHSDKIIPEFERQRYRCIIVTIEVFSTRNYAIVGCHRGFKPSGGWLIASSRRFDWHAARKECNQGKCRNIWRWLASEERPTGCCAV